MPKKRPAAAFQDEVVECSLYSLGVNENGCRGHAERRGEGLGYYNLTPRIYERICGHLSGRSEPERMEELLTSAEGTMPLCGSCQSLGAYVATGNPRGVYKRQRPVPWPTHWTQYPRWHRRLRCNSNQLPPLLKQPHACAVNQLPCSRVQPALPPKRLVPDVPKLYY